jgi:hypothetical protein
MTAKGWSRELFRQHTTYDCGRGVMESLWPARSRCQAGRAREFGAHLVRGSGGRGWVMVCRAPLERRESGP